MIRQAQLNLEGIEGATIVRLKGNEAMNELSEFVGLVNGRVEPWPHFIESDRHAHGRRLPGRLTAGEPASNDADAAFRVHPGTQAPATVSSSSALRT